MVNLQMSTSSVLAPLDLAPFRTALTNFRVWLLELIGLAFMPDIFIFLSSRNGYL
jgi:hypothetical protein